MPSPASPASCAASSFTWTRSWPARPASTTAPLGLAVDAADASDDHLANVQALLDSPAAVAKFLPPHLHHHQIAERNFNRISEREYADDRFDALNLTALDLLDAWNFVRLSFCAAVGIPADDDHDEDKKKKHHGLFSKHKHDAPTAGAITLDGRETAPMTNLVQLADFTDAGNGRHRAALASLEPLMRDYPTNKILFETFDIWERVLRDGQVLAYAFRVHTGAAPPTMPQEWTVAPRSAAPSFVSHASSRNTPGKEHVHAALAEESERASQSAYPQHRDPQYDDPTGRVAFPTPHPAGPHPCPSREHPLPPLPPGAQ